MSLRLFCDCLASTAARQCYVKCALLGKNILLARIFFCVAYYSYIFLYILLFLYIFLYYTLLSLTLLLLLLLLVVNLISLG